MKGAAETESMHAVVEREGSGGKDKPSEALSRSRFIVGHRFENPQFHPRDRQIVAGWLPVLTPEWPLSWS